MVDCYNLTSDCGYFCYKSVILLQSSRKPQPESTEATPDPSRLRVREISVSAVFLLMVEVLMK